VSFQPNNRGLTMMILTGSQDESTIFVLEDDSEIEIVINEFEGNRAEVIVCAGEGVSLVHKLMTSTQQI
jgi:hypothetical protein